MEIIYKQTSELIPYINNPRKNDKAVDAVASSIKNFGFKVPVIIDSQGEIIAGHTRLKAAKKLDIKEVPCLIADDLTPAQIKAFRIADNKVSEFAEWDMDLLKIELDGLDEFTGFQIDEIFNNNNENPYSKKVTTPIYEVTQNKPSIDELTDLNKTNYLKKIIENSNIEQEIKNFLVLSSYRHLKFNYSKIAEYYAHSNEEVQEIMEELALVIIDYDKAIEFGFVRITETIEEMLEFES